MLVSVPTPYLTHLWNVSSQIEDQQSENFYHTKILIMHTAAGRNKQKTCASADYSPYLFMCTVKETFLWLKLISLSEKQDVASENLFLLLKGQTPPDCINPSTNRELLLAPFKLFTLESTKNIFPNQPTVTFCYRADYQKYTSI